MGNDNSIQCAPHTKSTERWGFKLGGTLQGVGFRPWVLRLARHHSLTGFVRNSAFGAEIQVQGCVGDLTAFAAGLFEGLPAGAAISHQDRVALDCIPNEFNFQIAPSLNNVTAKAALVRDRAPCQECLSELQDLNNRRYRFAFTSCCACGPRYTIATALPFDRENTSMVGFPQCHRCLSEYHAPADRRFHSQINTCPSCGPRLKILHDLQGDYRRLTTDADIVAAGVAALRNGMIIAVKGVGGYQLLADPSNQATVDRLRKHKQRPKKPFAIMVLDMCAAGKIADFGDLARTALISPAAPIIVVQKRSTNSAGQSDIPDRDTGQDVLRPAGSNTKWLEWVAPDIGTVGVMLPSSSLYFLIASGFSGPLIVTSANLHADPIIYLDDNASREIPGLADLIISHNREIILPLEDSVVQIVLNTSQVLRAGRGYAPMEFRSGKMFGQPSSKVGFGADQRNAPSFFFNGSYYLGPYVGAMTSDAAVERAELVRNHFLRQIGDKKSIAVCDLQQNYRSSLAAEDSGWPLQKIQHHIAHGMATAAEHQIEPPFSAVVWDGFGAGTDGKLWGGEFFAVNTNSVSRYGSLLPFRLLAVGANAISPRLAGIALLAQTFPKDWVDLSNQLGLFDGPAEIQVLRSRVEFPARSVSTSSAGRLIDGIGAVLGLCRESVYEAYAGIVLNEYVPLDQSPIPISVLQDKDILLLDWRPIIEEAVALRFGGGEVSEFASRVWYSLAAGIQKVIESAGHRQVVLSGGCFHGPSLLTAVVNLLRSHHFSVAWPEKVPAGDGGIAFGQVVASNFLERQELG